MEKIRSLIVDDEPLARERLAGLPRTRLTSRSSRSAATVRGSDGHRRPRAGPVFLDLQMPQMNGFEVIEAVGGERMPLVIFVTATTSMR
jgi:two-component system LytT family response regulator